MKIEKFPTVILTDDGNGGLDIDINNGSFDMEGRGIGKSDLAGAVLNEAIIRINNQIRVSEVSVYNINGTNTKGEAQHFDESKNVFERWCRSIKSRVVKYCIG